MQIQFVFREPKGFMALRKSFIKIKLNSCLLPSIVILLAVWFFSLATQRCKFLPQEKQVNLFYSSGCYLMSLILLNVLVFRKLLWFFELVMFFYITLVNVLLIISMYRSIFHAYRTKIKLVADYFNRRSPCFCYYEFSYKIFRFLCIIDQFCCCLRFFCKMSHYLLI